MTLRVEFENIDINDILAIKMTCEQTIYAINTQRMYTPGVFKYAAMTMEAMVEDDVKD